MLAVNQLASLGSIVTTLVTTMIPAATGTKIGNMTAQAGLAGAFDGVTNQGQTGCAVTSGASTSGYNNHVGKDWGSGVTKIITRFQAWAPNDTGALGGAGGTTVKLQGSNDNSAWTDLYTSGTVLTQSTSIDVTAGIDTSTAYRYHRLNYNGNGSNAAFCAELQLYEDL